MSAYTQIRIRRVEFDLNGASYTVMLIVLSADLLELEVQFHLAGPRKGEWGTTAIMHAPSINCLPTQLLDVVGKSWVGDLLAPLDFSLGRRQLAEAA